MEAQPMIQIAFSYKKGTPPADIATDLRWHAGLLEGMSPSEASSMSNTESKPVKKAKAAPVVETEVDDDDDEDFAPKAVVVTGKTKKAKSFDDDEDDAVDADEEEEAPVKKSKAKKISLDTVNDACKARAAGGKRAEVVALLKKKFKVSSISELKPEQWPAVIEVMEA